MFKKTNRRCSNHLRFMCKKYISFLLALTVMIGIFIPAGFAQESPVNNVANNGIDETPVAEEPWTFELLEGDLPLDQLKNAQLSAADLPAVISRELADERQHVNRLYEQEPDDYTVMFQNRDGGKTVYVFSTPVKGTSGLEIMSGGNISQSDSISCGLRLSETAGTMTVGFPNASLTSRLGNSLAERPLYDYNIGSCDIIIFGTSVSEEAAEAGLNITDSARKWGASTEGAKDVFSISSSDHEVMSNANMKDMATGGNVCISMTYSSLAGEYALKHDSTSKYLANIADSPRMWANILTPVCKWLLEYRTNGCYRIRSQYNQGKYLVAMTSTTVALAAPGAGETSEWYFDSSDGCLSPSYDHSVALSGSLTICDVASSGSWSLTNYVNYVDVSSIIIRKKNTTTNLRAIFGRAGESFEFDVAYLPSNATYKEVCIAAPDYTEINDSNRELYLSQSGSGTTVFSYQYDKTRCQTLIPTLVAASNSPARFGNMVFEFSQSAGCYMTVDSYGSGLEYASSSVHTEIINSLTSLTIKRHDDYNTQFYIKSATGADIYTIESVKTEKYLTVNGYGTEPVLAANTSVNSMWRILELEDGTVAAWNPETTQLLGVDSSEELVTGLNDSEYNWNLRIAGVYKLQNSSTSKYMTVKDGYDTDESNEDNEITVNVITANANTPGSKEDLDSNQHFRIVYNDNISGYLLFPICSMNGSRRVIGKASASSTQVILKNYSSTALDRVNITYTGSNNAYNIKLGSQAMTDYNNSVVYNSFSSTSDNQKWILQVEYNTDSNATNDRMNREIRLSNIDIAFPLDGSSFWITSGYGFRVLGNNGVKKYHDGLDIGVTKAQLLSPFDGTVIAKKEYDASSGDRDERGSFIVIKCSSSDLYVWFYHLYSISSSISVGSNVLAGQQIGVTGNSGYTGSYPYGWHLHITFSTSYSSAVNHLHTFDPLWIYSDMIFSRRDSTDSVKEEVK